MESGSPFPREGVTVRVVTYAEVVARLRARVTEAGSQKAFARAAGLHGPDLCQVLRGRAAPSERQCNAVGVERALVMRDVAPAGEAVPCS
ncbi:hypothetical protein FV242_31385 [Methylobacterium sp. WL64]|uniref:hypothetical protein n=1 Tax=Methylobacterium sp. WL64 TaxID=2603894 RepID=UPI0011CC84C8|nr:hypothetical protein [Methylobacterium sp. WL64]TXM97506.1 hypothetical protein FV242_31385 [Methylobacterium sp. WL64]